VCGVVRSALVLVRWRSLPRKAKGGIYLQGRRYVITVAWLAALAGLIALLALTKLTVHMVRDTRELSLSCLSLSLSLCVSLPHISIWRRDISRYVITVAWLAALAGLIALLALTKLTVHMVRLITSLSLSLSLPVSLSPLSHYNLEI
jgi:hypothetical protein